MGVLADVVRLKKLVRKTLIREIIQQFPNLTEEHLRSAIQLWKWQRNRTEEELRYFLEHDCFPDGEPPHNFAYMSEDSRPQMCDAPTPVITEAKALKLIDDLAPTIPVETLGEGIYMQAECDLRTRWEIDFLVKYGYWPEDEPGKTESDIKYFQQYGCWPGESVDKL